MIDAADLEARDAARKPATPAVAAPPPEIPAPVKAAAAARPSRNRAACSGAALPSPQPPAAPRAAAIIPLMHVPDDPGPEPAPDLEPEPEPPACRAVCGCFQRRRQRPAGLLANAGARSLRGARFRRFRPCRRSSVVEHPLRKRGVGGSNPSAGTSFCNPKIGKERFVDL